jgi:hypothetical protein
MPRYANVKQHLRKKPKGAGKTKVRQHKRRVAKSRKKERITPRLLKVELGQRKIEHLPIEQAVLVPSTEGIHKQQQISDREFNKRVEEVRHYLSSKYGGYTYIWKKGERK